MIINGSVVDLEKQMLIETTQVAQADELIRLGWELKATVPYSYTNPSTASRSDGKGWDNITVSGSGIKYVLLNPKSEDYLSKDR